MKMFLATTKKNRRVIIVIHRVTVNPACSSPISVSTDEWVNENVRPTLRVGTE